MEIQELFKLSGIAIVMIGFALRMRTTLVVVAAALVTGLVAGLPLFSNEGLFQGLPYLTRPGQTGIVNTLGRAFADNRLVTLFIVTLPAIGLAERYGLQEQSAVLIGRFRAATVGRLQSVYQLFRVVQGLMGIRLNGHAPFVRPLLFPMSLGAARQSLGDRGRDPEVVEKIKAANGAAENYANFYGQNLSPVQAGVLMVFGVMQGLGYPVSVWRLVLFTIPVASAAVVIGRIQFYWFDLALKKRAEDPQ